MYLYIPFIGKMKMSEFGLFRGGQVDMIHCQLSGQDEYCMRSGTVTVTFNVVSWFQNCLNMLSYMKINNCM
jgi:hypothetical protein